MLRLDGMTLKPCATRGVLHYERPGGRFSAGRNGIRAVRTLNTDDRLP